MKLRFFPIGLVFLLLLCFACKEDYAARKQRELNSGVRHDSLFMGLYFGMPRADFYKTCLELNQQGIVTDGPQNMSVLYIVNGYRQPINMNYYPDFNEDKIYNLKVWFDYQTWAPWNKEYFSDQLVPDALKILEKNFGPGFSKQRNSKGKIQWAKVDGNREIVLRLQDERTLRADITDLSVTPKPNPAASDQPSTPRPLWEQHKK